MDSDTNESNDDIKRDGNASDSGGNQVYEVESVLDWRSKRGKREFKVRWKGYKPADDTWEPETNLSDAREILDKFLTTNDLPIEFTVKGPNKRKVKPEAPNKIIDLTKDADASDDDKSSITANDNDYEPSSPKRLRTKRERSQIGTSKSSPSKVFTSKSWIDSKGSKNSKTEKGESSNFTGAVNFRLKHSEKSIWLADSDDSESNIDVDSEKGDDKTQRTGRDESTEFEGEVPSEHTVHSFQSATDDSVSAQTDSVKPPPPKGKKKKKGGHSHGGTRGNDSQSQSKAKSAIADEDLPAYNDPKVLLNASRRSTLSRNDSSLLNVEQVEQQELGGKLYDSSDSDSMSTVSNDNLKTTQKPDSTSTSIVNNDPPGLNYEGIVHLVNSYKPMFIIQDRSTKNFSTISVDDAFKLDPRGLVDFLVSRVTYGKNNTPIIPSEKKD